MKDILIIGYAVKVIKFQATNGIDIGCLIFQVFDLGEMAPDKVLHQLYLTLEALKCSKDYLAAEIQKRLKIIVSFLSSMARVIISFPVSMNKCTSPSK